VESRYDSYCGLYCGACGTLRATEAGGSDPRGERCLGCKSDLLASGCLHVCTIRPCAINKGVESCGACIEFPCAIVLGFSEDGVAHHSAALRNLDELKRIGREAWLEAHGARWTCPTCGARFAWKDETCGTCGGSLYNSLKEMEHHVGVGKSSG
jgi:hypothetical protein